MKTKQLLRREIYWCVFDEGGLAMHWTVSQMRRDSIAAFWRDDPRERTWRHWKRQGYTCEKVTLQRLKPKQ